VKLVYDLKEISSEIVGLRDKEMPPADPIALPSPGIPSGSSVYGGVLSTPVTREYLLLKSDGKILALHLPEVTQAILPPDTDFYEEQREE
jgi:hypothetical protein